MAKKKKLREDERFDYQTEIRTLKAQGPERLYFLWGPEDYLREQFLIQLRKTVLSEGEDGFSDLNVGKRSGYGFGGTGWD